MKRFLTFLLLWAFTSSNAQTSTMEEDDASDRDTSTLLSVPWYNNNNYLENFLDSIGYPRPTNRIVGTDRVRYHVPIKFWVYRSTAGTGGPGLKELRNYIDALNRFYNVDNNTFIGFYMECDIGYVDDDDHRVINNATEGILMVQNHKEAGCINIHIADDLPSTTIGVSYRARFFGIDGIFLHSRTYTDGTLISTVAHEVGHYFELDHTHQYYRDVYGRCHKEAIDRNRKWAAIGICNARRISDFVCESTGDLLRDTPADHNLSNNNSCTYDLRGSTDTWGDHYETPPAGSSPPDPKNLMSYNYNRACRVAFSRLQTAVLLYSIVRGKSKGNEMVWKDIRSIYDDYEPDNSSSTAQAITKGQMQERNFHQQYNGSNTWSNCDVDWVSFIPNVSQTVSIATFQLPGYTTVNTRLTLFNTALTQLAQNDNISATNLYSNVGFNVVAGQTYFIRVENLSGNITGYYRLTICNSYSDPATYQISGAATVCSNASQTYSVTNLPAGTAVSWSASPTGILNVPATGNPINVSYANIGTVTLTATVTACSGPIYLSKTVRAGGYSSGDYPVTGPSSPGCNQYVYYNTNTLAGATNYAWFWPTGWTYSSGQGTPNLTLITPSSGNSSGNVGVRVANACDAGGSPGILFVQSSCFGAAAQEYEVSPNPASSEVSIAAKQIRGGTAATTAISEVNIYDQQGVLKKQQRFGNVTRAKVNVSNLPTGIYFIEIMGSGKKERQQLSILK